MRAASLLKTTPLCGTFNFFNSSLRLFQPRAAGAAIRTGAVLGCTLIYIPARDHSRKKKTGNMPPKKAVPEEKILLGRPRK